MVSEFEGSQDIIMLEGFRLTGQDAGGVSAGGGRADQQLGRRYNQGYDYRHASLSKLHAQPSRSSITDIYTCSGSKRLC